MDVDAGGQSYQLRSCLWELTLRCNLHCMHCGSVAGRARRRELTLEECFGVADELVGLGCAELTFIGGEIFLYQGWEQVARYASDRGLLVNIMTNAYGVGEEEIRQVKHAHLVNVGVSIDGLEATHNRIRGRPTSFARAVSTFDLLNREGIPSAAITSLLEWNFPELEPLYAFLVEHGVQVWQLQLVNPMGNMAGRRSLILAPDKLPQLIDFIREKNCERRMIVIAADSIGYYHDDSETYIRGRRRPICCWEGCQAGLTTLFIDSVGNVKGCGALYDDAFVEGNVRERRLGDIWADGRAFGYNRAFDVAALAGRCAGCDLGDVCRGGCRASNFFASGHLYANAFCPRPAALAGAH
jgi:radical SAM protein with 4Fe4S-binding SPASM domain